jgi:hypothetical protein
MLRRPENKRLRDRCPPPLHTHSHIGSATVLSNVDGIMDAIQHASIERNAFGHWYYGEFERS